MRERAEADVRATAGQGQVEPAGLEGLDLAALSSYLEQRLGVSAAGIHGRIIAGGRSNLTYELRWESAGEPRRWVLRRPPLGHVLETAHDMSREYTVISALAGTPVPVPEVVALCEDVEVVGAPFYLMAYVDGVVYRTRHDLDRLDQRQATALAHRLTDVLADLHLVDPVAVGLGEFGRPDGYLHRQVRRWGKQLDASRSRDVPGFDDLADALAGSVPESPRGCIVHGDYRLDNALVDADDAGRITAVLDWEMATLGDPLADLGMFVMYWDGFAGVVPESNNPVSTSPGSRPGFPSSTELAERYAERTGLDTSRLDWYVGLAFYKIAVILEGIHYRWAHGLTVGDDFDQIGDLVPPLVARGLATLRS